MDVLLEMLINGSPMAMFAAYLVYANKNLEKKLVDWQSKFLEEMKEQTIQHSSEKAELLKTSNTREDEIRDRWLSVVTKVEEEKDICTQQILSSITRIEEEVKAMRENR